MVKKKNAAEDLELEDQDDEEAEEVTENEEPNSPDEEESEPEEQEESPEEEGAEPDEDEVSAEEKPDPEREAIRARRRREKKMRRERERREKALLQNTIVELQKELRTVKDSQTNIYKHFETDFEARNAKEAKDVAEIYNNAQAIMAKAIEDADGKRFAEAKKISDQAWARYLTLTEKSRRPGSAQAQDNSSAATSPPAKGAAEADDSSVEVPVLDKKGQAYGINWVKRNASWYDPQGGNRDSKIVAAIDLDLYDEGYDPNTKEYWDELTDRCREVLPNRFKVAGAPKKPSIVGQSGAARSTGSVEKSLPAEFVQTLKAAGYWSDEAKRKAAIKNYLANKKGAK